MPCSYHLASYPKRNSLFSADPHLFYSAFISIVPVWTRSAYLFLTHFSKNGQKHEKWEELYILAFEEFFSKPGKNNYGGCGDFGLMNFGCPKFQFFRLKYDQILEFPCFNQFFKGFKRPKVSRNPKNSFF